MAPRYLSLDYLRITSYQFRTDLEIMLVPTAHTINSHTASCHSFIP